MAYYDVLASGDGRRKFPGMPAGDFPLQRMVLNVTNQCNLSCGYCYEYSEDKITLTKDKPKYMSDPVAQAAIDMLFRESAGRPKLHVTFFGGESLLNFPLMKSAVAYADAKASAEREDCRVQPHHQRHASDRGDRRLSSGASPGRDC